MGTHTLNFGNNIIFLITVLNISLGEAYYCQDMQQELTYVFMIKITYSSARNIDTQNIYAKNKFNENQRNEYK